MHIPLTFQLIIKRAFSLQTSSPLWSIPTNQHTLFKNQQNCHHSTIHLSYFHSLLTQLLHHISHTNIFISLFTPPQLTSPSIHPQHLITPPSPSNLPQATHITNPISQLFTNFYPSTRTTYIYIYIYIYYYIYTTYIQHPNPHSEAPISISVILQAMPACSRMKSCFWLLKISAAHTNIRANWRPQQLTAMRICGAICFTVSMPLLTTNHSLWTCDNSKELNNHR